jgi:hypothetical protein
MPIGIFESEVLRLIAHNRSPESHVAGATVLNQNDDSPRISNDIDLFHDTEEVLKVAFQTDVETLKSAAYQVEVLRDLLTFKRAVVSKAHQRTKIEWVRDSAFRFFPTEPDPKLGYRLNLWDAATNKVLAAAGRAAIRDYTDLLHLHMNALSIGALVWAAAGKDGGLSPGFILEEMQRLQKYPPEEYDKLMLVVPCDPPALKKIWLAAMREAQELFDLLLDLDAPYGCFFLDEQGEPQTPTRETLATLRPHYGSLRGCWPRIVEEE